MKSTHFTNILLSFVFVALTASTVFGQGNTFSFQGRLNDGTNSANGSYDLQFRLYDAIAGGTQIGSLVARPNTTLINGVFSVALDFGATAFNNPNSVFIEIAVRPNASPIAYTILGPRQQLTVVPFAVRAANATNADNATNAQNSVNAINATNATNATTATNSLSLGGLVASSYLQTNGNGSQLTNVNAVTATNATNALSLGNVAANGWTRLNVQNTGDVMLTGRILISGNATQSSNSNGLVKAMIRVTATGQIADCFNGNINSSSGNCGFTITHTSLSGVYRINFNFQVNNRFYSIVAQKGGNQSFIGSYQTNGDLSPDELRIFIDKSHEAGSGSGSDAEFLIIVY